MSDAFRFETFVDVHDNVFNEYLGSVVAKLSRENEEYRAVKIGRASCRERVCQYV